MAERREVRKGKGKEGEKRQDRVGIWYHIDIIPKELTKIKYTVLETNNPTIGFIYLCKVIIFNVIPVILTVVLQWRFCIEIQH